MHRGPVALAAVLACLLLAPAAALAVDVRGNWDFECGGPCSPQTHTFETQDASGHLTGHGAGADGSPEWTIDGTISGDQIQFTVSYQPDGWYTATMTGTVSGDGAHISGTFDDGSYHGQPFTMNRLSGPPTGDPPPSDPKPSDPAPDQQPADPYAPPEQQDTRRPTGIAVLCNRGPELDSAVTCTAQVGDGGPAPPVTPTGIVRWRALVGVFTAGDTCRLQQGFGATAFCTVAYASGPDGLPTGTAPPITVEYLGDAQHAASLGGAQRIEAGISDGAPDSICFFASGCLGTKVSFPSAPTVKRGELPPVAVTCALPPPQPRAFAPGGGLKNIGKCLAKTRVSIGPTIKEIAPALKKTIGDVPAAKTQGTLADGIIRSKALADVLAGQLGGMEQTLKAAPAAERKKTVLSEIGKVVGNTVKSPALKQLGTLVGQTLSPPPPAPAPPAPSQAPRAAVAAAASAPTLATATTAVRAGSKRSLRLRLTRAGCRLLRTMKRLGFRRVELRVVVAVRRGARTETGRRFLYAKLR